MYVLQATFKNRRKESPWLYCKSPLRILQHFILVIWNNLLIPGHPFQKFPEKLTHYYSHCTSLGSSSVDAFVYSDSCHAQQCQTHVDHHSFLHNQQKGIVFWFCQLAADSGSNGKLATPSCFIFLWGYRKGKLKEPMSTKLAEVEVICWFLIAAKTDWIWA